MRWSRSPSIPPLGPAPAHRVASASSAAGEAALDHREDPQDQDDREQLPEVDVVEVEIPQKPVHLVGYQVLEVLDEETNSKGKEGTARKCRKNNKKL